MHAMRSLRMLKSVVKDQKQFEILRRLDSYLDTETTILCDGRQLDLRSPDTTFFLAEIDQRIGFILVTDQLINGWFSNWCKLPAWNWFELQNGILSTVEHFIDPNNLLRWRDWLTCNTVFLLF